MTGFSFDFPQGAKSEFGAIAFEGESAANSPGTDFSLASLWGRGKTSTSSWEGELAAGRLVGSSQTEPAWRFALRGAKARWSWGVESQGASEAYPGTIWNTARSSSLS